MVKTDGIVDMHCFHADLHGRYWVLHLLDLTPDCSKSACIHPRSVALQLRIPGIHDQLIRDCNIKRG
jgi:hypothetical protein